jgi:hypothetical protein
VIEKVSQGQSSLIKPESHPVQLVKPLFTGLTAEKVLFPGNKECGFAND